MNATRTFISASALVAAFAGMSPALAQTGQTSMAAAKPTAASSWACASSTVEIAPVSSDSSGKATAWVLVHRVKGEVIAAERVNAKEVEQIRRLPCSNDTFERPAPLVG